MGESEIQLRLVIMPLLIHDDARYIITIESKWRERINTLLDIDDEDLYDVCFEMKDNSGMKQQIKCHKLILAQVSPIFKQQFFGPMKEENEKVEVEDSSFETFKIFIDFIYKEMEIPKFYSIKTVGEMEELFEMIYLAEKYQVEQLKRYLNSVLNHCISIDDSNVFQYLQEIEKYRCFDAEYSIMKERCFHHLDTKWSSFFNTSMPKIHDAVFLTNNLMTQLLKRGSFTATEMEVYKIAKAYVQTVIDTKNKKSVLFEKPKPDVPEIIELAVNFDEMSLGAINEVVGDEWLSEKFRFQLAKKAIDRNKLRLQTEKRRNGRRMEEAKTIIVKDIGVDFSQGPPLYLMNEIQFTSSENVLLHVGSNFSLSKLEFSQEGGFKEVLMKNPGIHTFGSYLGNEYIYIRKSKLVTLKFTELRKNNEEKYRYEDIRRKDFKITFKSNTLNLSHELKLSFCLVCDDFSELEPKEKNTGFRFQFPDKVEEMTIFKFGSADGNPFLQKSSMT